MCLLEPVLGNPQVDQFPVATNDGIGIEICRIDSDGAADLSADVGQQSGCGSGDFAHRPAFDVEQILWNAPLGGLAGCGEPFGRGDRRALRSEERRVGNELVSKFRTWW